MKNPVSVISGTGFAIIRHIYFQYEYETPFLPLQKKNAKKKKNLKVSCFIPISNTCEYVAKIDKMQKKCKK